ncbi:chemotaxis protein CheA [Ramlibacter tataouinensis]|uniref:chemotaxis protein CheA n=1 Tax=Ramlibacter tataouinensis TaxID=94132 RepID=UPI0022F3DB20|nr:chemotaxis protein CheA [Ramlibacter tataouinensis]WBY00630.1 chemotaxis protein CheA [Ramlibacter tataouinensis]
MDVTSFYQAFFEEADELLSEMELLLMNLDLAAPGSEDLNAIFRAAHSIKGGAATFGFAALTDTTHLLENILDRARQRQLTLRTDMIDTFLKTKDALKEQIGAYREGAEPDAEAVAHICATLRDLALEAQGGSAPAAAPAQSMPVEPAEPGPSGRLRVRLSRLAPGEDELLREEMSNLGTIVAETRTDDGLTFSLETSCSAEDIVAVCCFVIDADQIEVAGEQPAPTPAPAPPAGPMAAPVAAVGPAASSPAPAPVKESGSLRVDVHKVDQLINQVGELVITQSMLTQTASLLDPVLHDRLLSGIAQLERNARDLQESVMSVRMMPMDYVFSRFPRLIRDLSAKLGKQVELVTFGKETELDKGLIERVVDPLTHLVRNSLDHGIELPAERVAAGKDRVGRLRLAAQHQGGNIVIEVGDDGGGLSRERILAKAAQQGLAVSDAMSDDEVWQLIFAPGFSTADQITDVSGRGVGMDVVRRNIEDMGGHVHVSSRRGVGTTTRIVLPLTLAILNGMSVKVGDEVYILPLSYVIESLQPDPEHIHVIRQGEHVMQVRGEYLPLVALRQVFQVPGSQPELTRCIVMIVEVADARFALIVDHLVGQHQVVVKNLETNYRKVPGISGATILGDGSVALIVDVPALRSLAGRRPVHVPQALAA